MNKSIKITILCALIILVPINALAAGGVPGYLSDTGKAALDICPSWLKNDLADNLRRMGEDQDILAQVIIDHRGENICDELCFLVAHVIPWMYKINDFDNLLVINCQLLYEIDQNLDYVDIIDYGDPATDDEYWSTLRYWSNVEGMRTEFELDPDIYYWWVVHVKFTDETPKMDDAYNPSNWTAGYFWREYFYYNPSLDYDYTEMPILNYPNRITDDSFGTFTPKTYGYFTGYDVNHPPIFAITHNDSGEPCLMFGPRNMGCYIFTMIPVEALAEAGYPELLENLIMYGNGEIPITENEFDRNRGEDTNIRIAIFKDRDPFGSPTIENMLAEHPDWTVDIYSSSDMGSEAFNLQTYDKVIIPSAQPYSFYVNMEINKGWFESNIYGSNILQFHGACDLNHSWSGLDLPLGFDFVDTRGIKSDDIQLMSYPQLNEVFDGIDALWNWTQENWWPGEAWGDTALARIGQWGAKVLPFRARSNRPVQPNQVLYEHNGNCGELQDLCGAALRTCLVPAAGAINATWDHVWDEFFDDYWHAFQIDWDGTIARIDNYGVCYDQDWGGGKNIAGVWAPRGDNLWTNVTQRYSQTALLRAEVVDANGEPVDGADVSIWVPCNEGPPEHGMCPIPATKGYTGSDGIAYIHVGNNRDIWADARSTSDSVGSSALEKVIEGSVPDIQYTWLFVLPGELPSFKYTSANYEDPTYQAMIRYFIEYETIYGGKKLDQFAYKLDSGHLDGFVTSAGSYERFERGLTFNAQFFANDQRSFSGMVNLPAQSKTDTAYMVFSNYRSVNATMWVDINITLFISGKPVDSFAADDVMIPAGDSFYVNLDDFDIPATPDARIQLAGYWDSRLSSQEGGKLTMIAIPNYALQDLAVYYLGVDSGIRLLDDGSGGDWAAEDGIYTFSLYLPGGIPAMSLPLTIRAPVDYDIDIWPSLMVGE